MSDLNDKYLILKKKMTKRKGGKQGKRMKSLIRDINLAIEHTCHGFIDACRYLLSSRFNFVMLDEFTTKYLEVIIWSNE